MIRLTLEHPHASIVSFPPTTIPDFTLITGPNGAGKTHLLQAIENGLIKVDSTEFSAPPGSGLARMYDWSTLIPNSGGVFTSEALRAFKTDLVNKFRNNKEGIPSSSLRDARHILEKYGFQDSYLHDPSMVLRHKYIIENLNESDNIKSEILAVIKNAYANFEGNLKSYIGDQYKELKRISQGLGCPVFSLRPDDIINTPNPRWGANTLFQQNFAQLFVAYRDAHLSNLLAEFRSSKGEIASYLTTDEFQRIHGIPPWDFVNLTLSKAGIGFEIDSPAMNDYTPYQPTLRKLSNGVGIPFSSLSSGEKILMSFAFCVYYADDQRQLTSKPKVLLLDEIDAPLHPSMAKVILNTITDTLVTSLKIKVIATTHSPSTIALAPDSSIYSMTPGHPGLVKCSKASALNILTEGVPTIAISYDGRRQVFVESPTDAKAYDLLYKILKTTLNSERSLEFISTGTRTLGKGDENTGSDNVKRIVNALVDAGNLSAFGLIDWDGRSESTPRIAVLAENLRNGIENIVYDPLVVAALINRQHKDKQEEIGLPSDTGNIQFDQFDAENYQRIVDNIAQKVFDGTSEESKTSKYVEGLQLSIDRRFFTTDDHQLEQLIIRAFPYLSRFENPQKDSWLLLQAIKLVMTDRKYIPVEVRDTMLDLLTRDTHIA